jgi:transposase
MRKRDTRKLPPEAIQELRHRAVQMKLDGLTHLEVSRNLQVSITAVQNWVNLYRDGGWENLKLRPRGRPTGSNRTLTKRQERAIQRLIVDKTPEQLKMPFALWTRPAIGEMIEARFGISLPVRTLGEYLKRWGFTPQRPKRHAYEQQPREVRRWLDHTYPKIERRAKREGAQILWGDETGISNQSHVGRGYSPRGVTPVARGMAKRVTTSMISAVSNSGTLRFMVYRGALKTGTFLRFLQRLIRGAKKKVFLIVDNLRVHRSARVRRWVEDHPTQIELFYLPPYSPELNPDEYLNNTVKSQLRNTPAATSQGDIQSRLRSRMRSNQKRPALVRSLFQGDSVRYAA